MIIPDENASEVSFEHFIYQMIDLLHGKLKKQDEQLAQECNEFASNSPLLIQRKQLQRDLDDFQILEKHDDVRRLQQLIERIEHMSMFNPKSPSTIEEPRGQLRSTGIPSSKPLSQSCSYRVC